MDPFDDLVESCTVAYRLSLLQNAIIAPKTINVSWNLSHNKLTLLHNNRNA